MYDEHGLEGMKEGSFGGGLSEDLEEFLFHMFAHGSAADESPFRTKDAIKSFSVSLEDLYNGKHVKMMSKRKVVCSSCKGYDSSSQFILT